MFSTWKCCSTITKATLHLRAWWPLLAVPTGFEPATSGLTGRRELLTSPRDQYCYVFNDRVSPQPP